MLEEIEREPRSRWSNYPPRNYLNDWARRTGNTGESFDQFDVAEVTGEDGVRYLVIVRKAGVAETPTQPYDPNMGETVAPAEKPKGRGKSKTADKSHDPFA